MRHSCFISYAHPDVALARLIAEKLKSVGLDVWFDLWKVKAGDTNILYKINEGMESSDYMIAICTAQFFGSDFSMKLEFFNWLHRDLYEKKNTLIPLIMGECRIPMIARGIASLDFREKVDINALLTIIRH